MRRLLVDAPPDLDARVALYVCPECGDYGCGALTVRVRRLDCTVSWSEYADSSWDLDHWEHDLDAYADWPPVHFDELDYRRSLTRALPSDGG